MVTTVAYSATAPTRSPASNSRISVRLSPAGMGPSSHWRASVHPQLGRTCAMSKGALPVFSSTYSTWVTAPAANIPRSKESFEPRGFRHLLLPICSGNVNEGSIDLLVIGCATCGKQQHANSEAACSSHVHWPLLHHPMRPLPVLTMVPSSVMALNSLSNTPVHKGTRLVRAVELGQIDVLVHGHFEGDRREGSGFGQGHAQQQQIHGLRSFPSPNWRPLLQSRRRAHRPNPSSCCRGPRGIGGRRRLPSTCRSRAHHLNPQQWS